MKSVLDAQSPNQPQLLSRMNERLVLRMIQQFGPSTRAQMTRQIGVTFPTVAKAVASLLDSQLLEEYEEAGAGRGRPAKRLRLATEKTSQVLGISLEVDKSSMAVAGFDGNVQADQVEKFATPRTYQALVGDLAQRIKARMRSKQVTTHGVGISLPGLIDYRRQQVLFSANLGVLNNRTLAGDLSRATGVECLVVRDSHALCLSERLHGGAKHLDNFVMLDLCTGVGMGVMVNGRFLSGQDGFAGEIGHSMIVINGRQCHCGNKGCLETVASEWALLEQVGQRLNREVNIEDVVTLVREGSAEAKSELRRLCKFLAIGLSHVINAFNPGHVFVYGQIFEAFPELLDLLIKQTSRFTLREAVAGCVITHARTTPLQGAIASIISYLTDSRVPEIETSRAPAATLAI